MLVDSSGYGYARYTAPFLGARSYMTLRDQNLLVREEPENLTVEPDLEEAAALVCLWANLLHLLPLR